MKEKQQAKKIKNKKSKKSFTRLTAHIIPLEYDITLKPDLKNFTFEGVETIILNVTKATKALTLHSKEIDIETVSLEDFSGSPEKSSRKQEPDKIFTKNILYNQKADTATFTFEKTIRTGKYRLNIVFKGILNDKMRGFYSSKYLLHDKEHHIATTQFESTDARRAFPCFDEPAQKAVFNVSLVVPKGKTAISNTLPVKIEEHEAGFEVIRFAPTPMMSTYLLAFIVGDFEFIESKSKRGVGVRVFTIPGKIHQAKFALEYSIKTLDFYEEYFDINYPLPVLDMIAISDFQAGAMENWGAIIYRESALLIDEDHSSSSNKERVALVIAHEIAHQWFGNLVTMEWWTHLWLNEGFATYIEYLALDKLFPEWDMWTQFSTQDLGIALRLDALETTHPVEVVVHHPDEIGEIFDEVSYSKGASIIRMLASYLGEENFRNGLRYYLKKHSYKNTETVHLWEAFEKISGKPVEKIMKNWTALPGYPLIKVELKKNKDTLSLTQERFFASPVSKIKHKKKDNSKIVWQIPVIIGSNKRHKTYLISKSEQSFEKINQNWQKINLGESGFFRVAYSKELLEKLAEPILNKALSARDRLGIVRDLFALAESGDIKTTDALEFLKAYKNEDNYTVWLEITMGLSRLTQIFYKKESSKKDSSKIKSGLDKLTIELLTPIHQKLGWEKVAGELHSDTLLRALAISKLGRALDKNVIKKAKEIFEKSKKGIHLDPDLRNAIYGIVASVGEEKELKYFLEKYKKETLHAERDRLGAVLGDFTQDKILCEVAHFALSSDVRAQDTISILSTIGLNPLGRNIWLKCIKQNWKTLVYRYGDGGHTLARLMKAISFSAEEKHLKTFKDFFKKNPAPGAERSVKQVIEKMESNILWQKRDKRDLKKFFKYYS